MSNGEHEIRTPKGLRIGNRSVVDSVCDGMPEKQYHTGTKHQTISARHTV